MQSPIVKVASPGCLNTSHTPLEPRQSRKRNPLLEKVISCYRSLGPFLLASPGRTNSPHHQNNTKMTSAKRSLTTTSAYSQPLASPTRHALRFNCGITSNFLMFLFGGVNSLRLMKIYLPLTNYPRSKVHSQA